MGLNVSTTMGFENQEQLRNAAKNILSGNGASEEKASKIVEETIFESNRKFYELYPNSQLAIIKASSQISMNGTLKETLKYLREHAYSKYSKKHILGEIWENFSTITQESDIDSYNGELVDFQIDKNVKNIFAA